jgi:lysophospholipase L1-like esterase
MRKSVRGAIVVTALLMALTGCSAKAQSTTATISPAGDVSVMVALGDSLTAATNACGKSTACLKESWSTGSDGAVNSQATRLSTELGHKITVYNYAKLGATLDEVTAQATEAVKLKPDYITLLTGGNDFCTNDVASMTSPAAYKEKFVQLLALIHKASPNTKIYVASTPNPLNLWKTLKDDPAAVAKWSSGSICQSLLANPTSMTATDDERRQEVYNRAVAFNGIMSSACDKHSSYCFFDNLAIFDFDYGNKQYISTVDYFHPNVYAQAEFAKLTSTVPGLLSFILSTKTSDSL